MSWQYVLEALKHTEIPGPYQIVFVRLADAAKKDGVCWPGIKKLSRDSQRSRSLVYEAINYCIDHKLLERVRTGHRGQLAGYRLLLNISAYKSAGERVQSMEERVQDADPIGPERVQSTEERVQNADPMGPERVQDADPIERKGPECGKKGPECGIALYKNARAFEPGIEPGKDKEKEKDIHKPALDPSSEIPSEPAPQDEDLCVNFENIEDIEEVLEIEDIEVIEDIENIEIIEEVAPPADMAPAPAPPAPAPPAPTPRCTYYDPMQGCPHEIEALAWTSDQEGYRVRRHERLHAFLHEYSLDDYKLLYNWHLQHTEPAWRHLGAICGKKAPHLLALARQEQTEQAARAERSRCHHPPDQIILERQSQAFLCRSCNEPLSDETAAERQVYREDFDYDAAAHLCALIQQLSGSVGFPQAGD